MQALTTFATRIGTKRLALIGGSGLAALVAAGMLAMSSGPDLAYLYSDLDAESAQLVTEKLRGMGVDYQLSPDGTAVMAPVDRVAELRMSLASEQIGGKIGYEVLDAEEPFGTSASRAKINETRAVEGELARSIESLQRVRKARVHIVMPERQLFAEESRPASAAITLKTDGRLSGQQTDAIRNLVAAAVPELSPDRISIVDQNGTLLARIGSNAAGGGALDEREQAMENRMRGDLEVMLERIIGPGRVRAQVAVELDPEQVREESETFDPDRQVVAKSTTVETSDEADERSAGEEQVGVASQLPEAQADPAAAGGDSRRTSQNETSEEVTYDNSRVKKTSVKPGGDIRRVTVSVMVDGNYGEGGAKEGAYQPRSPAELERLTRLVQNAVGFDQARGDSVIVENMRFLSPEEMTGEEEGIDWTGPAMIGLLGRVLIGLFALIGLAMALKAWRSRPAPAAAPAEEPPLLTAANTQVENLTPEGRELLARAATGDEDAMRQFAAIQGGTQAAPQLDQEIDIAQINGRIKASTLNRLGDIVRDNTPEGAAVIRQWMNA